MTDNISRPIVGIENRTAQEVFDIMVDRIRLASQPPAPHVDGPTYLDFITPDDVFDKGPDAVKAWQEAERAGITNPPPPQHLRGEQA